MAYSIYARWTEAQLLSEEQMLLNQRSVGRTTEVRLAGELTRNDDRNTPALDKIINDIQTALYIGSPWPSGNSYDNPNQPRITPQSHY